MLPTFIVLLLVVVAVFAIVWVVRKGPTHVARPGHDRDASWHDPITSSDQKPGP